MKGLASVCFCFILRSIATQAFRCNTFRSSYGNYLKNHVVKTSSGSSLPECTMSCLATDFCRSTNYNLANVTCELSDGDKFDYPDDFVRRESYTYSGWSDKEDVLHKSCLELKKHNPFAQSGYYTIHVRGRERKIYCDLDTFGGGWSLVVSINSSSNDHLQTGEHNCFDKTTCVKHFTTNIPTRKLTDQDIRALALEGEFRLDVKSANPYTVFYKLPNISEAFSSACHGSECARIITSHNYPYQWESNQCNGVSVGYRIAIDHYVFDSHDDNDCGNMWISSLYLAQRGLYGYKIDGNTGIYYKLPGLLFVR